MSKQDFSAKKTEDRSEPELSSETFTPEKSGLSKEIKISLTAITVLLGVLGYALYGHFFGSDEKSSDPSVAAADTEVGTPATDPAGVGVTTDQSIGGGATATATSESQWGATARQEQPSTGQPGTSDASSGFTLMPSRTTPQTVTDRYSAHESGSTVETSTNIRSSDATAGSAAYSGQTRDPFQARTLQDTVGNYASQPQTGSYASQPQTGGYSSQPQTGGQGVQTYDPPAGGQAYPGWRSDSQPSAPGTAVVSSGTDTAASAGLRQSTAGASQTPRYGNVPDYPATGAGAGVQPTPQYSAADSQGYATSNSHGHTGGTGSTQAESRPSPPGYNYNVSSQPSVPPVPASGVSVVSTSPDSSQYGFSDDKPADGKYIIQPNDSYWSISKKLYATDSFFGALAHHNRAAFPDANRLGVGEEIETPDESELVRLYPDLCPKPENLDAIRHRMSTARTVSRSADTTVYVVQEGDTLFDIARYELGKASRWAEIYKLNRDRLGKGFDYLTPGLELVMPSESVPPDQPVGTMTQRLGARRQF